MKGERASAKASQKARIGNVVQAARQNEGLTSYEELMSGYETAITKTPSGKAFEIQSVDPGNFVLIYGSPFLNMLNEKGIDLSDSESIQSTIEGLSDEDKMDAIADASFMNLVKAVVCQGVISVNFVNKPQYQCSVEKQEISVELLNMADLLHVYNAIFELTRPEKLAEAAGFFREGGEKGGEGAAEDTPDQ